LASGEGGLAGAMLAVGTSFEDGKEMCELEDFEGRVNVAACNSPSSITISGDSDAIAEVQLVFEEEGKFVRPLKVNTAYHSHHMLRCQESYMELLQQCNIQISKPAEGSPIWYSSVDGGARVEVGDALKASYWLENMVSPVLFAQAIECAIEECEQFDVAVEIGPHPALKGPVQQTIEQLGAEAIPYFGVLNRGKNDLKSFLDALGSIWTHCGSSTLDLARFQRLHYGNEHHALPLKDMPSYAWNHEREYWNESRAGKQYRTHETAIHEFLGRRTTDGVEDEWRWENVLRTREISWLSGHALQGVRSFHTSLDRSN
jgi:hybrid polyketide synthase/nonribosomal peptide synthetase ACE1